MSAVNVAAGRRGCLHGEVRRFGKADAGPASDLLGGSAENGLRYQQVVGEIEVLRQPLAGKPLENLAIAIHHGTQAIARDAPNTDQVLATERDLTSTEKTELSICRAFPWAGLGSNQ